KPVIPEGFHQVIVQIPFAAGDIKKRVGFFRTGVRGCKLLKIGGHPGNGPPRAGVPEKKLAQPPSKRGRMGDHQRIVDVGNKRVLGNVGNVNQTGGGGPDLSVLFHQRDAHFVPARLYLRNGGKLKPEKSVVFGLIINDLFPELQSDLSEGVWFYSENVYKVCQ